MTLAAVHVADAATGSGIDALTDRALTFVGAASVTIPAGQALFSDPVEFSLRPLSRLAVTIVFGDVPAGVTGHPGSRTTSYLAKEVEAGAASLPSAAAVEHWYVLTGVDVFADAGASALVTLGDSLTDGRGSTTDGNDRWPDVLSRRLRANAATRHVAVLNQGVGGNAVLAGGLGTPARVRFAHDVLGQPGARWLVLLEGVNDIGAATDARVAGELIAAFAEFVAAARAQGLRAYGVPILPFGGSFYASDTSLAARRAVNDWIRTSGTFDAVIDLDAVVRDPADPGRLRPDYDCGDHLHLSPAGYRAMGEAIDLSLFVRPRR